MTTTGPEPTDCLLPRARVNAAPMLSFGHVRVGRFTPYFIADGPPPDVVGSFPLEAGNRQGHAQYPAQHDARRRRGWTHPRSAPMRPRRDGLAAASMSPTRW